MAYYFQLANIQIFPSERLDVILDFWNFAESIGLEKIAYALTNNIISSLEPSLENAKFGSKIAEAHIYNSNFDDASKWILFYKNSSEEINSLKKVEFLLDLYKSKESKKTNYSNATTKDEYIRDRIIAGTHNAHVRQEVLEKNTIMMNICKDICHYLLKLNYHY